jgi:hypothetical protein
MTHCQCLSLLVLTLLPTAGCDRPAADDAMNTEITAEDARSDTLLASVAEHYVRLVLAAGQHDGNYVDSYYGEPQWKADAEAEEAPLDTVHGRVARLAQQVGFVNVDSASPLVHLRKSYLTRQLASVEAFLRLKRGEKMSFDEESQALYDATAPTHDEAHFRSLVDSLNAVLPGAGPVPARLEQYRRAFVIPREKVDTVFKAAIAEARRRTAANIELPEGESFTLEYVTNKPWSGYNWYQGNLRSLIQINTDLPIFIDRAIDLAAHEGYPGHHVYNLLLEHHLVRGRKWPEYSVFPLFSPQALISEGSANYGIDVAFPGDERLEFEREVLYPLAGLDASRAEQYSRVNELVSRLSYAGNEAARAYLDGKISADSAAKWLNTYALMEPARAQQRVRFIDTYRSYVINYNYGRDLVRDYIESSGGTADNSRRRWQLFRELLSSPRLPSDLRRPAAN